MGTHFVALQDEFFYWEQQDFRFSQDSSRCPLYLFFPALFPDEKKDTAPITARTSGVLSFGKIFTTIISQKTQAKYLFSLLSR